MTKNEDTLLVIPTPNGPRIYTASCPPVNPTDISQSPRLTHNTDDTSGSHSFDPKIQQEEYRRADAQAATNQAVRDRALHHAAVEQHQTTAAAASVKGAGLDTSPVPIILIVTHNITR